MFEKDSFMQDLHNARGSNLMVYKVLIKLLTHGTKTFAFERNKPFEPTNLIG